MREPLPYFAMAWPIQPTVLPRAKSATVTGTERTALRALVVALDAGDFGVATWRSTLDRVGAAYEVARGALPAPSAV